jgi:hypothetical protein
MIGIIIGLIIVLILGVVSVNAFQQHKEKLEQDKKALAAKQKAIIDETEILIMNLIALPQNPVMYSILNSRSLNAAKEIQNVMPDYKGIKKRINEFTERLNSSKKLQVSAEKTDESFNLPNEEKELVVILQCIKKLRAVIRSEQSKGALDPQVFTVENTLLEAMQLKINVESIFRRGNQAYGNDMLGSARQYYEKAIQTLNDNTPPTEYSKSKLVEVEAKLAEITDALQNSNARDAAQRAKDDENDLDKMFETKKKW